MIYFDNAATGGFKVGKVTDTAVSVLKYLSANPGRSGHRLSVTGAKIVLSCRETLARFFGGTAERVVFTKNCTEALNLAIFGYLKGLENPPFKVVTTVFEHNSVLRPLSRLEKDGLIRLVVLSPENGDICGAIEKNIAGASLVVTTAASNVTGEPLPVGKIGELCKKNRVKYLVDGAQGGGHIPINMKEDGVSMLALAGHKGLYGIMGSGALLFDETVEISPLLFGGTGVDTFNPDQPDFYPERLESGTLNLPAIAALAEGVGYVENNFTHFSEVLNLYTATIIAELKKIKKVRCYSLPNRCGIVSFGIADLPSETVADELNKNFDIAVRGGFHCAPLIHKFLHTAENGLVRASLAVQNGEREINLFLKAVRSIADKA